MKMSSILAATALVSALSLGSVASAAELIVNGDFESSPVGAPPAGFTVFPGMEIQVENGQNYVFFAGGSGSGTSLTNQFASFGSGDMDNISVLSQVVSTMAGQMFNLGFDFGVFGSGSQTLNVGIFDSESNMAINQFAVTRSGTTDLNTIFSSFNSAFTAQGALTRISFSVAGQNSVNVDGLLDNVSISGAVPEPATWGMLIVGFGAMGGAIRASRRRRITNYAIA
jgi:hypothetical protein